MKRTMSRAHRAHRVSRRSGALISQAGLTLVELLISMILGLLMVAAVASIYLAAGRNVAQQDAEARLQQSSAAAMAVLTQQIQKAGWVEMPAEWTGWQDAAPDSDRFAYLVEHSTDLSRIAFTPTTVHGCDHDYAGGNDLRNPACATGTTAPAALTLAWQVARTPSGSAPSIATPGCLGAVVQPLRQVADLRSVGTDGVSSATTFAWTSCRLSLDAATSSLQLTQVGPFRNSPRQTQGVADNVVDLGFRYLLGAGDQGSRLDGYARAADIVASGAAWSRMRGIEVCLLMRVAVPASATKTYPSCGLDAVTHRPVEVEVTDRFAYRALRSVVVLRSRIQASAASL